MYAVKEGHIEIVKECFDLVDHAITTKVYIVLYYNYYINSTYTVNSLRV